MTSAALAFVMGMAQAALSAADTGRVAPDVVVTAPADGDLDTRFSWAERTARERRFDAWWIGWTVTGDPTGASWYYIDRHVPVGIGGGMIMGSIRLTGSMGNLNFRGVTLGTLTPPQDLHDTAILLRFTTVDGRTVIERVHAGSHAFPIFFNGGALLWLGRAEDGPSVQRLRMAFNDAVGDAVRRDLVSSVGAHRTAAAAAPALRAWLENDNLTASIRREAADWLAHHPHADATAALTRIARADTSATVRSTAMRGLARVAAPDVAVAELARLARDDDNARARRDAVNALGTIRDQRAFRALVDVIEQPVDSSRSSTRRDAMNSLLRQAASTGAPQPQEIIDLLVRIARNDGDGSVRSAAVDALANLRDPRVTPILVDLARNHADPRVMQRATTGLGRAQPPEDAVRRLRDIAFDHPRNEVQTAAVRALVVVGTEDARRVLADIAERHPRPELRRSALQAVLDRRFRSMD